MNATFLGLFWSRLVPRPILPTSTPASRNVVVILASQTLIDHALLRAITSTGGPPQRGADHRAACERRLSQDGSPEAGRPRNSRPTNARTDLYLRRDEGASRGSSWCCDRDSVGSRC